MDTPALAIARSLWWRNKRNFLASAITIAVMAAVYPLLFTFTRADWVLAASTLPLLGVFAIVWNGLLFVEEPGNMASHYPRYMLTLPASTFTLILWPLVFSSTLVALLWAVTAALVYNTSGFNVPILLPSLGCAAMMAWLQVGSWTPIASKWLRPLVTVLWLSVLASFPTYLLTLPHKSPVWFGVLFVIYIATAVPLGLAAVSSQRRGDFWRVWPRRLRLQVIGGRPAPRRARLPFGSADAAQSWYEWKCHGLFMPAYVGGVLLLIWGVLLLARKQESVVLAPILGLLLGLPPVLAGAAGPGLARFKPISIKDDGIITFLAIRPLTSGQIVLAKFKMGAQTALLTWIVSLLISFLWILLSDNLDRTSALARTIFSMYPGGRATAIVALTSVLLPALTWKQMTDGFAAGLSGRRLLAAVPSIIYLAVLVVLVATAFWSANHPEDLSWLIFVFSIVLVLGAVVKGAMAFFAFRSALRQRLMSWRAVTGVLGLWLILTVCGVGLATLLVPMPAPSIPVSWPILVLGIGVVVPLVRFPAATLALEWNRHR